jgi:hypothetical protein
MASSGILRRVAPVRIDVSEEINTSIIRVKNRWTTNVSVSSNRRTLRRYTDDGGRYVPPKRGFLYELHGVISEKTQFFIVTKIITIKSAGTVTLLTCTGMGSSSNPCQYSDYFYIFHKIPQPQATNFCVFILKQANIASSHIPFNSSSIHHPTIQCISVCAMESNVK